LAGFLGPGRGELSRERLKAALLTAEGLLLQPRGEGERIELSEDEAVAASVAMVAGDRLARSASSHIGGAFKRNARGAALSERAHCIASKRPQPKRSQTAKVSNKAESLHEGDGAAD
jgi:hypothetical protein